MKDLKIVVLIVGALFVISWIAGAPLSTSQTIGVLGCLLLFAFLNVFEKRLVDTEERKAITDLLIRVGIVEEKVKSLSSVANLREVVRSAGK